jgi:hypothetical protein
MPKIQNSFLKGKMNNDLDERLVPKGEYRDAQNILITQSENSDVGAVENIQGNALALTSPFLRDNPNIETIGYFADTLNKRAFWFVTDFAGDDSDVRSMSRASSTNTCAILMGELDNSETQAKILVQGRFLNFSTNHLITGVNLIDDLLFFTDNYNQPRKINVTTASSNPEHYTKEEQISVAKVAPYLAPMLYKQDFDGVITQSTKLTNDTSITSDFLKDRFVRFSYRYKYADGEFTTMAPFTQIVFKPLNDGVIDSRISTDTSITDYQDVYSKTILDVMKNNYNKIELRIPLPSDEYVEDELIDWQNELDLVKLEILVKESDQDVVKVVKEIDVNANDFNNSIEKFRVINESDSSITYFRHVYKYVYRSEKPFKILEDKQITRVFDQVPVRAKAQEISGNRVIYGNFTENYNLPTDSSGKTGINYVINTNTKGAYHFDTFGSPLINNNDENLFSTNKYHSLKQRRKYQVGIILADKFGRQSPVILSTNNDESAIEDATTDTASIASSDTVFQENVTQDFSGSSYTWNSSVNEQVIGRSLFIRFLENNIVSSSDLYDGDINSSTYNPYGWYSYKFVVKQQEQEYYNIYTSHPADTWNNESNGHDDVQGFTWISLYGDNINKVPRDVNEVDEIREGVAGSDTKLFPKVIKKDQHNENSFSTRSVAGPNVDPIEVMTIGTAREQGILTQDDRDKDRVHDFVMAKRNPLLAQVKSIGTNNRVKYGVKINAIEANTSTTRDVLKFGKNNETIPYVRVGQQLTKSPIDENAPIHDLFIAKRVERLFIDADQEGLDSKSIKLNRVPDKMKAGQIIEFESSPTDGIEANTPLSVTSHFAGSAVLTVQASFANVFSYAAVFNQVQAYQSQLAQNANGNWAATVGLNDTITVTVGEGADAEIVNVPINTVFVNGTLSTGTLPSGTFIVDMVQTNPLAFTITLNQAMPTSFMPVGGTGSTEGVLNTFTLEGVSEFSLFRTITNTTATREIHGDEVLVRRPVLQEVELVDNNDKAVLHFDRRVLKNEIPGVGLFGISFQYRLYLWDPITIKSVETNTVDNEVIQTIQLSHELEISENEEFTVQNLESEPVAVRTGLTVLETDPFVSNIDIFFESSTSGLIRDLHNKINSNRIKADTKEISYFNTFILAGGGTNVEQNLGEFHVEESRIKGEFNGKSVDFGVRAHLIDTEYAQRIRGNALIHSGIYNAKTLVNKTNEFSIGENITKAVDIQNGTIQKLYAEDTNLIIFQENKVNIAAIDKDIIFTQEGQPLSTASKVVIGQVVSVAGKYGISKNPESFAVHGNRKYFADKNRGTIMRLSRDGLTPISDAGMRSFFRDNLAKAKLIYGMYDEQKNKYVVSLQNDTEVMTRQHEIASSSTSTSRLDQKYATLSYDEASKGWVSFYTYKPTFGFSLSNEFYTYNNDKLFQHYRDDVQRCKFYGNANPDPANIEFVFNDQPSTIKNFHTIDYEGSTGWQMSSAETDMHQAFPILSSDTTVDALSIAVNFVNKENKYYGHIRNNTTTTALNQIVGVDLSGIKGYFNKVKMQYWKPTEAIASSVNKAELYAVSSETVYSSQ